MNYPEGTVLFAGPDDEQSVMDAKEYIEKHSIEKSTVRLVRMSVELENGSKAKIIALIVK